jgi:hypothetical protein
MSFVKLTQNRHPERSASQIYRVYTAPMARSRRTSAMHISPRLLGAFQPPKPPEPYGPPICFCCRLGSSFLYKEPLCPPPAKLPSPKSSCSGKPCPDHRVWVPHLPRFPAEVCGVDTLHAPFLNERRTSGTPPAQRGRKSGSGLCCLPRRAVGREWDNEP